MKNVRSLTLALAAATVIGMPLLAWVIMSFLPDFDYPAYFISETPILWQIAAGMLYGTIAAFLAQGIISLKFMKKLTFRYAEMIGSMNLNTNDIIFISFCAGFGEEVLFRGVIQPHLGIFATSVIFVALHGYISFVNWRMSIYGGFMTLVIIGIGYLVEWGGLIPAIIAHTIIDVILLLFINRKLKKIRENEGSAQYITEMNSEKGIDDESFSSDDNRDIQNH